MGKKWTPEEENMLIQRLQENMTIKYIATVHQRTTGSITARRKQIAYNMHQEQSSIQDIIDITKLTEKQILETIRKMDEEKNTKNVEISFEQFAYKDVVKVSESDVP